jgi:hypothetical protein
VFNIDFNEELAKSIARNLPSRAKEPRERVHIQTLAFLMICGNFLRPQDKKGSATVAKEVGVENATEETSCHRASTI